MIASHRFASFATSVSAALLLSACQPADNSEEIPAQEATSTTPTEQSKSPDKMDVDVDYDMTDGNTMADETQMTDILKDYTKSMTSMHNEMMVGMGYNDPDTAFAKSMLGHHHGAIDMAKIELKYGIDEKIRQLAQGIIDSQQAEIDIINKWLASHPDAPKPKQNTEAMQQAYTRSMDVLNADMVLGIADPVPDMAFARGMLPHHIGAVDMAKVQLQYGTDEEMRQLAQDIIDAQQPEIEVMQKWINTHEVHNGAVDTSSKKATENDVATQEKTKA